MDGNTWFDDNDIVNLNECKQIRIGEKLKEAIDYRSNLLIYFLDTDTVSQVSWEEIVLNNIILKRVDIKSWEDLEECNFTISYP